MKNDDLNKINVILCDASGLCLVLKGMLYDLVEQIEPNTEQNRSLTAYEVLRSKDAYRALIDGVTDKIIDSRRLLEAGMKQGGDIDGRRA
ncbi:MAG: hypothetical protein ACFN39_02030 [Lacticaseibacillus rhamnosus]